MAVITFASSKGGVGKTTSALILACEMARRGARVVLIDGDRNQPLTKWAALPDKPERVDVIADTNEETITATIERATYAYDLVIVDLEGSANAMIIYAVSRSDLVIVPLKASVVDAHQATKTLEAVERIARSTRQKVHGVLLLTMAPASVVSAETRAVQAELTDGGWRFLPATIVERVAYRALFSYGGDLSSLPAVGVGNLDAARGNAVTLAAAVIGELNRDAPATVEARI
ncbi:MAG: ParA family protein [Janthinobacterium lividum]